MSQAGVLPGPDDVLDAGVDAVGSIGISALAPPAAETLPNVPAHSQFDFFGTLGDGIDPQLTGTPVSLTDMPHAYDLTAKVTNTTGEELTAGVTQQVVLYDQEGQIVGGDTGSSDDVPQDVPAGMSYRELRQHPRRASRRAGRIRGLARELIDQASVIAMAGRALLVRPESLPRRA